MFVLLLVLKVLVSFQFIEFPFLFDLSSIYYVYDIWIHDALDSMGYCYGSKPFWNVV